MFKTVLGSSLLAAAQAIAFNTHSVGSTSMDLSPVGLAQISASNGCCCSYMPCMPTCQAQCNEEAPVKPVIKEEAPEPVKNVVLNLDVILTSILHEIHPSAPDIVMPEPGSPDEHTLVTNVIEPIVIQLLNNDILPAIPKCTFPGTTTAEDWGVDGEVETVTTETVDTTQLVADVVAEIVNGMNLDLGEGVTVDDLTDRIIASDSVSSDINIGDGSQSTEVIVTEFEDNETSTVTDAGGVVPDDDTDAAEITENIIDSLDEAGINVNGSDTATEEEHTTPVEDIFEEEAAAADEVTPAPVDV